MSHFQTLLWSDDVTDTTDRSDDVTDLTVRLDVIDMSARLDDFIFTEVRLGGVT